MTPNEVKIQKTWSIYVTEQCNDKSYLLSSSLPISLYLVYPDKSRVSPRPNPSLVHWITPILFSTLQGSVTCNTTERRVKTIIQFLRKFSLHTQRDTKIQSNLVSNISNYKTKTYLFVSPAPPPPLLFYPFTNSDVQTDSFSFLMSEFIIILIYPIKYK